MRTERRVEQFDRKRMNSRLSARQKTADRKDHLSAFVSQFLRGYQSLINDFLVTSTIYRFFHLDHKSSFVSKFSGSILSSNFLPIVSVTKWNARLMVQKEKPLPYFLDMSSTVEVPLLTWFLEGCTRRLPLFKSPNTLLVTPASHTPMLFIGHQKRAIRSLPHDSHDRISVTQVSKSTESHVELQFPNY